MKKPFLLIRPKIVLKNLLIKKGGCFEYHAVIADKIEYRYVHRASICPASGMDRRSFFIDLIAENLLISPHKCLRHHEKMA